jgi:fumarate hydratase subunit beta
MVYNFKVVLLSFAKGTALNTHNFMLPLRREQTEIIRAGDAVLLSGELYTARDAAHKRFIEMLDAGLPLPFPVENSVIYYTGPSPAPPGELCGSIGPTTSGRMDVYTPRLLSLGLRAMIGKGNRSPAVIEAIKSAGAVYLGAIGGAGALLAACVKKIEVAAFDDLGAEAVFKLKVEKFPTTALIDSLGNNLYVLGPKNYLLSRFG